MNILTLPKNAYQTLKGLAIVTLEALGLPVGPFYDEVEERYLLDEYDEVINGVTVPVYFAEHRELGEYGLTDYWYVETPLHPDLLPPDWTVVMHIEGIERFGLYIECEEQVSP